MRTPIAVAPFVPMILACGGLFPAGSPLPGSDPALQEPAIEVPEVAPEPATPTVGTPVACPADVIVVDMWEGEWPGPVVHVKSAVAVPARWGPCDPTTTTECVVPPGVYHPWAGGVRTRYLTANRIERWETTRATTIDGTEVSAGTLVEVVSYGGEGYCGLRIGGREGADMCPDMTADEPDAAYRRLPATGEELSRQLFEVACQDGMTRLVEANEELVARPGVASGTFPEYGEAGPSEP